MVYAPPSIVNEAMAWTLSDSLYARNFLGMFGISNMEAELFDQTEK
jgi:hypothetical protein